MPYQRCLCICLPGMVTTGAATACSGYIWDIGSWCAGALGATAAHGPGNAEGGSGPDPSQRPQQEVPCLVARPHKMLMRQELLESLCVVPAGMPSLPLSVPGGLFLAPLGSSMPSSIGFHAHQALYGGSPRSNGHVELFQRSSLPSGGSLPLKLPRSGSAPDAASSLLSCDMQVTTQQSDPPLGHAHFCQYKTFGTCIQDKAGSSLHQLSTFSAQLSAGRLGHTWIGGQS